MTPAYEATASFLGLPRPRFSDSIFDLIVEAMESKGTALEDAEGATKVAHGLVA